MTDRSELDGSLLTEITRRMKQISERQHELARHQRIFARAATQLRTGKGSQIVLAEIREQDEELMRDYCDVQVTLAASPLRTIARAAASA